MNTCSSVRLVVFVSAVCLLLGLCLAPPRAEPPNKPLIPQQKEKLKERDRFVAEMKKLQAAGKWAEAIAAAEKVLALEREVFGPVHLEVFGSWGWLAMLHEQREDFAAAHKARKETLEVAIKLYGKEHWRVMDARLALADLELRAKLPPDQRQRLREATADNGRVIALYEQGKYREALVLAENARKTRKSILGEKHPDYATSLNNLAELYRAMGDYARAEPLYRQARDIRKEALGEKHPDYATSLNSLAMLYQAMGDYAQAELLYRQARDIRKETLGEKHPDYALSLSNLATLYQAMGDYAKAEPLHRQARDIRKEAQGEKHPDCATSLNNLAMLYMAKNEAAQGLKLARQALAIMRAQLDLTA